MNVSGINLYTLLSDAYITGFSILGWGGHLLAKRLYIEYPSPWIRKILAIIHDIGSTLGTCFVLKSTMIASKLSIVGIISIAAVPTLIKTLGMKIGDRYYPQNQTWIGIKHQIERVNYYLRYVPYIIAAITAIGSAIAQASMSPIMVSAAATYAGLCFSNAACNATLPENSRLARIERYLINIKNKLGISSQDHPTVLPLNS